MAAEMAAIEYVDLQGCLETNIASSFCTAVFWSRKYEGLWFLANNRIYLAELTLEKLRAIKISNSDNAVVQHLIARHEYLCAMER